MAGGGLDEPPAPRRKGGGSVAPAPSRKATTMDFIMIVVVVVNEAMSAGMLFPYIGLLVVELSPNMREADAGMASGFIVGSFQLAQALSGGMWGKLSDRYGRKPVIAASLFFSIIASLLFGLSTSVWQLLVSRFLYGFSNCTSAIAKAVVAEITDETNEGFAWAVLSVAWAVGGLLGPIVGGVLYDPARHVSQSTFEGTVFDERPALLPCLVASAYALLALIAVLPCMRESNPRARLPAVLAAICNCTLHRRRHAALSTEEGDPTPHVTNVAISADPNNDDDDADSFELREATGASAAADDDDDDDDGPTAVPAYGLREMINDPVMARCLLIYITASWVGTAFQEVLPLLAILPVYEGGFGMHSTEIGVIFAAMAVESVISNLFFPALLRRVSRGTVLRVVVVGWGIGNFFTPAFAAFDYASTWHAVGVLSLWLIVRTVTANFCFSIIMMGIGALAPKEHLGIATSISHSLGNCVRAVFPPALTMLFAWSVGGSAAAGSSGVSHANWTALPRANRTALRGRPPSSAPMVPPTFLGKVLGPGTFPTNKWLAFIIMGSSIATCLVAAYSMSDDQFKRKLPVRVADDTDTDAVAGPAQASLEGEGPGTNVEPSEHSALQPSDANLHLCGPVNDAE